MTLYLRRNMFGYYLSVDEMTLMAKVPATPYFRSGGQLYDHGPTFYARKSSAIRAAKKHGFEVVEEAE